MHRRTHHSGGQVAFGSALADRAALASAKASAPATWPDNSGPTMKLDGEDGSTYAFSISEPGTYAVTASTFGPEITTPVISIVVK